MTTLMEYTPIPQFTNTPLVLGLEPNNEWKQRLKRNIEAGLRFMVDEAKRKLNNELARGVIGPEERKRLTDSHLAALKKIRQLAEEQFQIALELERRERWWASEEPLDRAWSESMMREQMAILDGIEMNRKNKTPATSLRSDPLHPPPPPFLPPSPPPPPFQFQPRPDVLPSESSALTPPPYNRKAERVDRMSTQTAPRTPTRLLGPRHKDSIRSKPHTDAIPIVPEFWKPSITPEEDAQMSRTFTLARRSNTASATSSSKASSIPTAAFVPPPSASRPVVNERSLPSITPEEDAQIPRSFMLARRSRTATDLPSFRPPSILSVAFTDPLVALSTNVDQERSSIYSADQEWARLDQAQEKDREREGPGHWHTDDRSVHSSNHGFEDRIGFSRLPATFPSSVTYPRPGDISKVHVLPSGIQPIVNEKSLPSITPEEDTQTSRTFALPRRSSTASAASCFEASSILSVAFTDPLEALSAGIDRERSSIYSTDQEWSGWHGHTDDRSVHSSNHRLEDRIKFSRLPTSSPSSTIYAQPGDSFRVHVPEALLEEEEAKWEEEEAGSREQEANSREMLARQKGEDARWKVEVKMTEEEARRKEEEMKRKEREVYSREMMVRRKEEEVRRKEEELRKREDELRCREEGLDAS